MISKEKIRKLENPLAISYLLLLLVIYFAGRYTLEMYTTTTTNAVYWWVIAVMSPFIIYATLRLAASNGGKWYGYLSYFLIISAALIMTGSFAVSKADLLISSVLKPSVTLEVPILKIEKKFHRKNESDHTLVTLLWDKQPLILRASPKTYYLLENKKTLTISTAQSFLGNRFVTDLHLQSAERNHARWLYLKEWGSRNWYLPAFIVLFVIGVSFSARYFPAKPQKPVRKIGFWRLIAIVMGIVFCIGLLFYLGLIIYIKFMMLR